MLAASRVIASLASMSMSPPVPVVESFKASVPVPEEVSINDESEFPASAIVRSSPAPLLVTVILEGSVASMEKATESSVIFVMSTLPNAIAPAPVGSMVKVSASEVVIRADVSSRPKVKSDALIAPK